MVLYIMRLNNLKKYKHFILTVVVMLTLSALYNYYKKGEDRKYKEDEYNIVRKYLLNGSSLAKSERPIIWIHLLYESNAREWDSFGSRRNENLNQPFQLLTIKSIIDKCDEDFNICLIDDDSFYNILPGWDIDMSLLSEPLKQGFRHLAVSKLLYYYGGITLPSSIICFKSFIDVYNKCTSKNTAFIGELVSRNINADITEFFPDVKFMGCIKGNRTMLDYSQFLEKLVSSDFTSENQFDGTISKWWYANIKQGGAVLIPSQMIGASDIHGVPIIIDTLFSDSFLELYPETICLYIPADEILKRTSYQWFARLSTEQVLESQTAIGKYLLLSSNNM